MKRAAVWITGGATALIASAYAMAFSATLAPVVAPLLLALGTALILAAVMALGAQRGGRLGPLWIPVGFVVLVVGGGLSALVLMPPADPAAGALILGLPRRAALLMYGVGLLPTLVVPVAYALTFERFTLSDEDLARVRSAGRAARGEGTSTSDCETEGTR